MCSGGSVAAKASRSTELAIVFSLTHLSSIGTVSRISFTAFLILLKILLI